MPWNIKKKIKVELFYTIINNSNYVVFKHKLGFFKAIFLLIISNFIALRPKNIAPIIHLRCVEILLANTRYIFVTVY